MNDTFYKSIMAGIAEMEAIKADYEKKQAAGVVLEACSNMINPMKRAVARGLHSDKVEELRDLTAIMVEAQKHGNSGTATAMAEQIIYEIIVRSN